MMLAAPRPGASSAPSTATGASPWSARPASHHHRRRSGSPRRRAAPPAQWSHDHRPAPGEPHGRSRFRPHAHVQGRRNKCRVLARRCGRRPGCGIEVCRGCSRGCGAQPRRPAVYRRQRGVGRLLAESLRRHWLLRLQIRRGSHQRACCPRLRHHRREGPWRHDFPFGARESLRRETRSSLDLRRSVPWRRHACRPFVAPRGAPRRAGRHLRIPLSGRARLFGHVHARRRHGTCRHRYRHLFSPETVADLSSTIAAKSLASSWRSSMRLPLPA